ncbi:MAG: hypothetical protein K6U10_00700 [Acidobacteriia bacterium]|nr:hypothetical protein [Methyloceanibacter sp.]MBX5470944.1 hypothetical protein [Acetobacteraceae bacterium]MCL6490321.1 hypothetical protein [Terriglobia bacterium]
MADHVLSSNVLQSGAPLTEDDFLRDRQRFFSNFTRFAVGTTAFLVILLILLAVFLL